MLLERDAFLRELNVALADAASGQGCAVLVSGEAGIGKTTLLEHFAASVHTADGRTRVLWGACDALFTPRPLGPLLDMARQAPGTLRELRQTNIDRERLFVAVLDELSRALPRTVAIFEDVHWADEATLDLLKFLVRRIGRTNSVIVLSFRDDEVDAAHPLRRLLGDLPARTARRLTLPPLSESAVARLAAAAGRRLKDLHGVTGGNPFYVTEVLATEGGGIPASVRDAVLARTATLTPSTIALLDVVSVVPGRTERWLLERVLDESGAAVQECVRTGVLRVSREDVAFRHELARRAWEESLEPRHAADLHGRVLRALESYEGGTAMLSRLVHHADHAGDLRTVITLAPSAAREAAALGAHREAAAHYASALRYVDSTMPAERAALLDAWSYEVHLSGRNADALRAREEALALWRRIGDRCREGDDLRVLSRLAWFDGRRDDAAAYAADSIRVLEPLGPSHELAMAYSNRAQLHILAEERLLAPAWGDRAVEMAEQLDDPEALVHALTNSACLEPGSARQSQVRAARLAQEHGLHEHAMRAFTWLISDAIAESEYALAERYLPEAVAYAEDRDMDGFALYLRGWRARMRTEQGRLDEAQSEALDVLRRDDNAPVVRLPALIALATVYTRRGDPKASATLDEALTLALATGELQRIAPVANARAEAAWLRGDHDAVRTDVMLAYPLALDAGSRWDIGRLASWLNRADALGDVPAELPEPFALEIAGQWQEAARAWEQLGCPYEQALALAEGDESAQRDALDMLDRMGAAPAATLIRGEMLRRGVRAVPRGPRRSTQKNPAGLTNREMEVLSLLGEGLTNGEIGRRLFLSTRTVDHHVSSMLRKLGASSRARAAIIARDIMKVDASGAART
jgi:DNA-binding CsgD family transcriptional regulator/tetratricopeptide (TPR) repeat protein